MVTFLILFLQTVEGVTVHRQLYGVTKTKNFHFAFTNAIRIHVIMNLHELLHNDVFDKDATCKFQNSTLFNLLVIP